MAYGSGGVVPLYGVVICDALDDPTTTLDRLAELRDAGRAQLEATGDLAGALDKLEAEISSRKA
jgi:hypothetical protein